MQMQLPQPAMLSSINAPIDDPNITVKFSIKDIITDIVRLQGEELIRVRNELEKAHSLNASALEIILALQETLAKMQNENDALFDSLKDTRESLREFCGLVEQPSPFSKYVLGTEQQDLHPIHDHQCIMTEGEDTANATGQISTEVMEGQDNTTAQSSTKGYWTSFLPDADLVLELDISRGDKGSLVDALKIHGPVQQNSLVLEELSLGDEFDGETNSNTGKYPGEDVDDGPASTLANRDRPISPFDAAWSSDEEDRHLVRATVLSTVVHAGLKSADNDLIAIGQRFVSAISLCRLPIILENLPQQNTQARVQLICTKALGNSPKFLEGPYQKGKIIVNFHNQDKAILIAVSKENASPCKLLKKAESTTHWRQTFIVKEHSGTKWNLRVLGEYEYRGCPPTKLALSEYKLLPETAKDFIFDSGRSIRKDIKTKKHVAESLVKQDGIAIHKIVLEVVRSRFAIEQLIAKEARRMGH